MIFCAKKFFQNDAYKLARGWMFGKTFIAGKAGNS